MFPGCPHIREMSRFENSGESAKQAQRAANVVRVRLVQAHDMIAYMALMGAAIGGFAGAGVWLIAVSAVALAALSRAEYYHLYDRAAGLGLHDTALSTTLQSVCNALIASGVAYAGGCAFRLF